MDVVRELRSLIDAHIREWGVRAEHMGLDRFTLRDLEDWAEAIEIAVGRRNTMHADTYWYLLNYCRNGGKLVDTRVGPAREVLNIGLTVLPFSLPRRQKMRRELGYMELAQFITGTFDISEIARVAPNVDMNLFGASAIYGPRVWNFRDQLRDVISELRESPNSRRAIITITDSDDPLSDNPCLSSLQFQLRNDMLFTTANFRSWDLWFGAPHDLIVVSGLAQIVGQCISPFTRIGPISVFAANAHIYQKSIETMQIVPQDWSFSVPKVFDLDSFRTWGRTIRGSSEWKSGVAPGIVDEYFPKAIDIRDPLTGYIQIVGDI